MDHDSLLSRTAIPVLLTASLLRAIISLDPGSLNIHLDCVFFHTQLLHITSVAVWISLSISCFALLSGIVRLVPQEVRFAVVLSQAAQSSLLLFSFLRVVKAIFPHPIGITSLDGGLDTNTHLLHGVSVSVWISLTITCFVLFLLSQMVHYGAATYAFACKAGTVLAIPYIVWVVNVIYQQWVSTFSLAFQFVYAVPSIALLAHTTYQAYFVFSSWKCLRLNRQTPVQLSWSSAWTNILYNVVMIAHMTSVAVVIFKDKGISALPLWLMAIDLLYRLLAICVFCRMYYYMVCYTEAVELHSSVEELQHGSTLVIGSSRINLCDIRNVVTEHVFTTIGLPPTHNYHGTLVAPPLRPLPNPSELYTKDIDVHPDHYVQGYKEEFCC